MSPREAFISELLGLPVLPASSRSACPDRPNHSAESAGRIEIIINK